MSKLTMTKAESDDVISALWQWLASQEIPERDWAPILARALGKEVRKVCKGDLVVTNLAFMILHGLMKEGAER